MLSACKACIRHQRRGSCFVLPDFKLRPIYSPTCEIIIDADIHQLNVSGIAGELVTIRESTG